jgi:hypothetical protein
LIGTADPAWRDFLATTAHDFYHLPGFAQLEARRLRGTARALLVQEGDRMLLLPLILRPVDGSRRDATTPYGYPGPLTSGQFEPAFVGDALERALPVLRDQGVVSLFARLHPILNPSPVAGPATLVHHGQTVAIDLRLPAETIRRQTRRDHRQGIDRSLAEGHRAWFDEDWTHFDTFQRLYWATMQRVAAADEYYFDARYFDGLRTALGDRLRLLVVDIGGEVAAAGLIVESGGILAYHLTGIDERYLREAPSKLLIHAATDWGRERGDRYLHLGGGVGGAHDSLYEFKAGFSRLRLPFHTLRLVVDPEAYEQLTSERVPDADPTDLQGFFPIYRRAVADRSTAPIHALNGDP